MGKKEGGRGEKGYFDRICAFLPHLPLPFLRLLRRLDQHRQRVSPFSDQNGAKMKPDGAAHTPYNVKEYPYRFTCSNRSMNSRQNVFDLDLWT